MNTKDLPWQAQALPRDWAQQKAAGIPEERWNEGVGR